MNKIYESLLVVVLMVISLCKAQAQLYISDDFISMPSTEIYVNGDVTIAPMGSINHQGIISFTGDLSNLGNSMYAPGNPPIATMGTWILSGSVAQNVSFGNDTLANITLNNSDGINGANMIVGGMVTFTNGQWLLAATDARLLSSAIVTGANATKYFVTDGAGQLYRDYNAAGLKVYPIGTAVSYAPLELNPQAANKVGARVAAPFYENPETQTNIVTENAVALTWVIIPESIISAGDIGLSYPSTAELTNFTRADANIVSWKDGSSTSYLSQNATTTGVDPYSTELAAAFEAAAASIYYLGVTDDNMFKIILNVNAFLEGAYINGGSMTTALSAGGNSSILATNALTQPYGAAPWPILLQYAGTEDVAASFFNTNTDIVDWVLIELRDKTDNTLVVARRAGLLTSDGSIVDTNGLAGLYFSTIEPDDYYIVIRHRNHLGVMGANTVYLDYNPLLNVIDFTTAATTLYGTIAAAEVETGVFALHMGNALPDNNISFTGANNDKAAIGIKVNSSVSLINTFIGYSFEDIDLNGEVLFTGSGNDKAKLGVKINSDVNLLNTFAEQLP